jgi:AraC family L-rhamnose operon transcriptional activator RhaR
MDGRIFYLKERILENLQHDWTIEELAAQISVSAPYLQRLFKSETGMPPMTYLRDLRLDKAREFLEADNKFYRISEIGYQIGISDDSHFTCAFKKKFGVTLTEYRKQCWEKIQAEKSEDKK